MTLGPQDFRDVLVLSRETSLKGAASVLGVDASTVGRRLEGIEARFGGRLFLRTARGFQPTADGAIVVAAAAKMEAIELAFGRELLARDAARGGVLTVTSAEWGVPLLTPVVARLAGAHPELQFRLRIENRSLDLTRREADVALRVGRPSEKALVGRRVGVVRYGLYASRGYLDARGVPRRLDELAAHSFCGLDEGYARLPNVRWQAKVAAGARVCLQTNSMLSLVEAVRSGGGIAALPCVVVDGQPDLRRVLPSLAAVERDLWLVFHQDLRHSRALRAVIEALVSKIKPLFS